MKIVNQFILFLIPAIFCSSLFSQSIENTNKQKIKLVPLPNADAINSIEIKDSIAGVYNVSAGFGDKMEINSGFNPNYTDEENSAWFKFTITQNTLLYFDIIPLLSGYDYDFILYKCLYKDCSSQKDSDSLKMVRSCYSMCKSKSGMTGLSKYATGNAIAAGPGPAYAAALDVLVGETYYLMVHFADDYFRKGYGIHPTGFSIYFYDLFPKPKPITLNNIFFESSKDVLKPESFIELDSLATLLKTNPFVIEIRGYTDNVGDKNANLLLSEARAKAVVDYLLSKGIDKKRLFYKGFGSAQPIASNNTEAGRQKNRRVEFVKVLY